MAITASAIAALVGRYNNKVVVPQALLSFPALDKKVVKTLKKPTERGTINVKAGGLSSTGLIADAGTLPTAASNDITQLTYDPTFIMSRLSIPRGGSTISRSPEDGVDVVMEQMETSGRDLGRTLGRAFFKSTLSTPAAAVSTGADLVVTDVAGWRIGATVEHRESGGNLVQEFTVSSITLNADGTNGGTVTTSADFSVADKDVATTDVMYLKGAQANTFISMHTAASADDSLYGQAVTALEWKGNEDTSTATFSPEALRVLFTNTQRRGGEKPTHVLCNALNEQRIYESMDDEIRYIGKKMDQYGMSLAFNGTPVFVDDNCPDTHIFLHNSRVAQLHCFREFAPDFDGDKKPGMSRAAVIVSDTTFTYDVQIWGSYQGRYTERRCLGLMSAITG